MLLGQWFKFVSVIFPTNNMDFAIACLLMTSLKQDRFSAGGLIKFVRLNRIPTPVHVWYKIKSNHHMPRRVSGIGDRIEHYSL